MPVLQLQVRAQVQRHPARGEGAQARAAVTAGTECATMNGSSTVLEHKLTSKEQERLPCHSLRHAL